MARLKRIALWTFAVVGLLVVAITILGLVVGPAPEESAPPVTAAAASAPAPAAAPATTVAEAPAFDRPTYPFDTAEAIRRLGAEDAQLGSGWTIWAEPDAEGRAVSVLTTGDALWSIRAKPGGAVHAISVEVMGDSDVVQREGARLNARILHAVIEPEASAADHDRFAENVSKSVNAGEAGMAAYGAQLVAVRPIGDWSYELVAAADLDPVRDNPRFR